MWTTTACRWCMGYIVIVAMTSVPCLAQPYVDGQNWQGGVGVNGRDIMLNTDADPEPERYPIIPQALADNSIDVQFLRSPDSSIVYARAFGSALTGVCSSGDAQVYMFAVVQDDDNGGHLETIFNGGLSMSSHV